MEPQKQPFEAENHFPNLHFWVPLIFRGVQPMAAKTSHQVPVQTYCAAT